MAGINAGKHKGKFGETREETYNRQTHKSARQFVRLTGPQRGGKRRKMGRRIRLSQGSQSSCGRRNRKPTKIVSVKQNAQKSRGRQQGTCEERERRRKGEKGDSSGSKFIS